jgi:hypothetical protein
MIGWLTMDILTRLLNFRFVPEVGGLLSCKRPKAVGYVARRRVVAHAVERGATPRRIP